MSSIHLLPVLLVSSRLPGVGSRATLVTAVDSHPGRLRSCRCGLVLRGLSLLVEGLGSLVVGWSSCMNSEVIAHAVAVVVVVAAAAEGRPRLEHIAPDAARLAGIWNR